MTRPLLSRTVEELESEFADREADHALLRVLQGELRSDVSPVLAFRYGQDPQRTLVGTQSDGNLCQG